MRGVIAGIDGSTESNVALDWALAEAAARHLPLTAVLAWEPSFLEGLTPTEPADFAAIAEHQQERALTMLDQARHRTGLVSEARAIQLQGSPATALLSSAETNGDADMIVLGQRGLGRLGRLILGSVSAAVAQHAHVPVTVVRGTAHDDDATGPAQDADPAAPMSARLPVLVGVDGSTHSVEAIRYAAQTAAILERPLEALLCWQLTDLAPLPDSWGWTPPLEDYEKFAAQRLDEAIEKAEIDLPDDQVIRTVRHVAPGKGIVAASHHAERLIVGSRGLGGFDRLLLGSVSRQALEYAHCAVTVIHPGH